MILLKGISFVNPNDSAVEGNFSFPNLFSDDFNTNPNIYLDLSWVV